MKHAFAVIILMLFLLASCNPLTPTMPAEPISVQYTAASILWLDNLNDCTDGNTVTPKQVPADLIDPQSVDLAIRVGQPDKITSPAYQIGSEEILVITNSQNPVKSVTAEQVQGLFNGQITNWQEVEGSDAPVQVWVFAAGEDVEQIFEQTILEGSPVTSMARLAVSPEEMAQAIANDVNAVGVLTSRRKTGNISDVYTVATVPVLAITNIEPKEVVEKIIACMQR
jgi:hypothetical protein